MKKTNRGRRPALAMPCAGLLGAIVGLCLTNFVAAAQEPGAFRLCKGLVFSVEEDFVMGEGKPPDGNPIVSDGDLLSLDMAGGATRICARNGDLIKPHFDVEEDMGLDAVDVVIGEKGVVIAFSTELDSPHGNFKAGDLLATNGAVIPNAALLALFKVRNDLGLDAIHFVGESDRILELLDAARAAGRETLEKEPRQLAELLKKFGVDIWFSTEGTGPTPMAPGILDGDLLSAATGAEIAGNEVLLQPPIPAGIPARGVDFGLDAVSTDRKGNRERILLSTEILYESRSSFTDGDVLSIGGSVVMTNAALIASLKPKARFVGLDALSVTLPLRAYDPNIQTLCGDHDAVDFDGGRVPVNGPGSGLYTQNSATMPPGDPPRRPCGMFVPIDGFLPDTDVKRFRVAYRPAGVPAPAPGDTTVAKGVVTKWKLRAPHPIFGFCSSGSASAVPLETDSDGWMSAKDYLDGKSGTPGAISDGCANSGLRLAVWDTLALPAAQKNAHFVVWLEWEDMGGTLKREPFDYHIQLDNTAPAIAPYPDGLQVKLADGSGRLVPACGEAPSKESQFEVWGQFADSYYWHFNLTGFGGEPPISVDFGTHSYYDPDDGPPGLKNTDGTGTTPDLTTVHLRNIDMTAFGSSFKRCCYLLRLEVLDAAILHNFNQRVATPRIPHRTLAYTTFQAG